jgi:hypothetical protein
MGQTPWLKFDHNGTQRQPILDEMLIGYFTC